MAEKEKETNNAKELFKSLKDRLDSTACEASEIAHKVARFGNISDGLESNYEDILVNLDDMKNLIFKNRNELLEECHKMQIGLQICEDEHGDYQSRIRFIEDEVKVSCQVHLETEEHLSSVKNEIELKEHQIRKLQEENAKTQQNLSEQKIYIANQEEEIQDLKRCCQDELSKKEQLEAWFKDKAAECEKMQLISEQFRAKAEEVDTESKELREENQVLSAINSQMYNKSSDLKREQSQMKNESLDLKQRLGTRYSTEERKEFEIEDLNNKLAQYENENGNLKETRDGIQGLVEQHEKELESVRGERDDVKEQLWQLRSTHIETMELLTSAEEKLKILEYNCNLEAQENDRMEKTVKEMSDFIRLSDERIQDLEKIVWQRDFAENSMRSKVMLLENTLLKVKADRNEIEQKGMFKQHFYLIPEEI